MPSSWKPVTSAILRTFGDVRFNKSLFQVDPRRLNISRLPVFYHNLFKVWKLFKLQRATTTDSLYWLLKEPLIHGALLMSGLTILEHLVDLAGPNLQNTDGVAAHLGLRSIQIVHNYSKNGTLSSHMKKR